MVATERYRADYAVRRSLLCGVFDHPRTDDRYDADQSGSVRASSGIVTIGGGIRNVDLYSALQAADATITHGRCIGVGAAGFLLGGGIGFNMRRYGLGCDQVLSSELVTANGEILTLSATENPDLFWACCGGGGGNFGINTSFSLQTMPADDLITVFEIMWSGQSDAIYAALVDALQAAPPTMGNRIGASAVTPAQLARGTGRYNHAAGTACGHVR